MSDEDDDADQPAWATSWERHVERRAAFHDGGDHLVALAVTRVELRALQSGLLLLPQSEVTLVLLDRLAVLHDDLDDVAEQGRTPR